MNHILQERGIYLDPYYMLHVFGFLAVLIMNMIRSKHCGISIKKSTLTTCIVYASAYLWMLVLYWVESGFRHWGGQNIVRIFVWLPVLAWPIGKLMKFEWRKLCDFIAPCLCLSFGVSHFGCLFPGCCHGYPNSWGIYSKEAGTVCFPVQIFEAVTALAIAVYILIYAKNHKFKTNGITFPIMLVLYGSTRFFWEFFRDNKKLVLGISNLAFHALFMCIVGWFVLFFWIPYKRKKEKNLQKTDSSN